MALVPTVKDRVKIPVIAAGGIVDRRGVRAAFALGADAVQVGTAFLACSESGAAAAHKEALREAWDGRTVLTRAFTGRLARYLPGGFAAVFESEGEEALPFPAQSWLTAPIRQAAGAVGERRLMALYAGHGAPLVRHIRARALFRELVEGLGR